MYQNSTDFAIFIGKLDWLWHFQQNGGDTDMTKKSKDKNTITINKILHKILKLLKQIYELVVVVKSIIKEIL